MSGVNTGVLRLTSWHQKGLQDAAGQGECRAHEVAEGGGQARDSLASRRFLAYSEQGEKVWLKVVRSWHIRCQWSFMVGAAKEVELGVSSKAE
jgi:hypothetical protein